MSVKGEFHRVAEDCVAYLEASSAPDATHWSAQLRRAVAASAESLDAAASTALDLVEGIEDGALLFSDARERKEFDELAEHLASICRAITGRPDPRNGSPT